MKHSLFKACALGLGMLALSSAVQGSDYNDDLGFTSSTPVDRSADLLDLYVFRSPLQPDCTTLILTSSPFANAFTPTFFDSRLVFEFKIDQNGDALTDLTYRVTFGTPDAGNLQSVKVTEMRAGKRSKVLLANGQTRSPFNLGSKGRFQAGLFDDPSFFDRGAFDAVAKNTAAATGTFPRAGAGINYFGAGGNCLAIVLEVPSPNLLKDPTYPVIGVWGRVLRSGKQIDRVGRPFTGLFFLPPLPYSAASLDRIRFNAKRPDADRRLYRQTAVSILVDFWHVEEARAGALVDDFVFPDLLRYDTSLSYAEVNRYPNGRRLRDDVADIVLGKIQGKINPAGSVITSDVVESDSAFRDGEGPPAVFPYLKEANASATGPQGVGP